MTIDLTRTLLALAIATNLVVMVALVVSAISGRIRSRSTTAARDRPADRSMAAAAVIGGMADELTDDGVPARTYDRVVRIVSWVFLLTTALIVVVSGLWPANESAILVLLVIAGLFVVVIHDLLPEQAFRPVKFAVEGSVAITVATMLVALTGGIESPFFYGFVLIVAGAALVVSPPSTIALALIAGAGYIVAVVVGSPAGSLGPETAAVVGVNLTAMVLLAYVATVIAREQRRSRDAAIRLSTIDPLTTLFNRGFFFAALEREIARSARSGRGFCLLMMDLDELKEINDRMGHFHGDRVLRMVAAVIVAGVRRIDTAARYGGDEFVVLLPETDPTGAFIVAEKVRIGVQEMSLDLPNGTIHPSLSIGVVSYPIDGASVDSLMISADAAMYRSKRAGKNCVTGVNMSQQIRSTTPVTARR